MLLLVLLLRICRPILHIDIGCLTLGFDLCPSAWFGLFIEVRGDRCRTPTTPLHRLFNLTRTRLYLGNHRMEYGVCLCILLGQGRIGG